MTSGGLKPVALPGGLNNNINTKKRSTLIPSEPPLDVYTCTYVGVLLNQLQSVGYVCTEMSRPSGMHKYRLRPPGLRLATGIN